MAILAGLIGHRRSNRTASHGGWSSESCTVFLPGDCRYPASHQLRRFSFARSTRTPNDIKGAPGRVEPISNHGQGQQAHGLYIVGLRLRTPGALDARLVYRHPANTRAYVRRGFKVGRADSAGQPRRAEAAQDDRSGLVASYFKSLARIGWLPIAGQSKKLTPATVGTGSPVIRHQRGYYPLNKVRMK